MRKALCPWDPIARGVKLRIFTYFPGKRRGAGFSFSWRPKALAEPRDLKGVGGSRPRSKPDENDTFWHRRPKYTEKMI